MKNLLNKIKNCATKKRIKDFEIYIEKVSGMTVEVKEGKVDSIDYDNSLGYGIRIIKNNRMGFSFGTDFSADAIRFVVDRAVSSANHSTPNVNNGWGMKTSHYPKIKNHDSSLKKRSKEEKISLAQKMEETALQYDKRVKRVRYANYQESYEEVHLFNSSGIELNHKKSDCELSMMAVAESRDDSEMAQDSVSSPFFEDLNPSQLGEGVAEEAVGRLGGQRIPNYKGPIVINPSVAVDMLEVLMPSLLAENIHKKNSFLIGKLGKTIYLPTVTLVDDGLYEKGERAFPFDAEGTPRQRTRVVDKGVVRQFLYDSFWANHDSCSSTGNSFRENPLSQPELAVSNFYLQKGKESPPRLFKKMNDGILITEAIGVHTADPISGDFSVGVQGYLIRGGKKSQPVRSVALAGNLHQLFANIDSVGSDLKFYGETGSPSILIREASISGE